MKRVKVTIEALSPLILTDASNSTVMTATKSSIDGTILRGVLAHRYIGKNQLGDKAHADDGFRKLFFGGLRFVAANPMQDDRRSFVLPLSLQKEKQKDPDKMPAIQDLLTEKNPEQGYKSLRGLAVEQGDTLIPVHPRTNISLHLSRSAAKERLIGSSREGHIFNYESIDAGQSFCGYIYGEEDNLRALAVGCGCDNGPVTVHIGRSHYTQYGTCRMTLDAPEDVPEPAQTDVRDNVVLLRLDTVFLPDPTAQIATLSQAPDARTKLQVAMQVMGEGFHVTDAYSAAAEVENFVGVWGMKQARQYGLAAGTVFALQKDSAWTEDDLKHLAALLQNGIGVRREEGFGQLCIWPNKDFHLAKRQAGTKTDSAITIPDAVRKQVQHILQQKILEQLRIYAWEDTSRMSCGRNTTHFFARLLNLLEQARGPQVREKLRESILAIGSHRDTKIHDKEKSQSPFERTLKRIDVGAESLYELLAGSAKMPYAVSEKRSWLRDLGDSTLPGQQNDLEQLLSEAGLNEADFPMEDGVYFYEYWHWVLRYARKKAATQARRDA